MFILFPSHLCVCVCVTCGTGFSTIALLSYKNLEKSTNESFALAPNERKPKFQMNSEVVTATVSNLNTSQLMKNVTLSFRHFNVCIRLLTHPHPNVITTDVHISIRKAVLIFILCSDVCGYLADTLSVALIWPLDR